MGIRKAWEKSLLREGHVRDPAQQALVERLEALQLDLESVMAKPRRFFERFFGKAQAPVPGLYIWGGVGRGKTFLMDLFFESLMINKKKRIHFHRMMHDVHARLAIYGDIEDPLDRVAADIASETRVLCFDEFFVSDIADAMILARLLKGLFERGVTLITTSNAKPENLYKDGLQRSRFLPAIELLRQYTQVINIDGGADYRLRLLEQAGTYLAPDDLRAREKLERLFAESASTQIEEDRPLLVNGRKIDAFRCAKSIAWFEFEAICDGPRSQSDYIELARWYPTVIVSGVPRFDTTRENQARRFIALVDEFYDRRVKLILSAASDANALYAGQRLHFEFKRTASRLTEMQSSKYLHEPHLA
ncbi:MAG: cell division protein ZapE [Gammaproteobacteria bacterium]|nr:cell division protein ZapE [Gammaproteobacteria bacterium]